MKMPSNQRPQQDPFIFDNDKMVLPQEAMGLVPADQQEPHVDQFCLGHLQDKQNLNDLLKRVFQKKALIWSLEKSWTKEGDCMVAVFYSNIITKEKRNSLTSGSTDVHTVGNISPEVVREKIVEKEDKLFNEFIEYTKELRNSEIEMSDEDKYEIEDD